MSRRLRRRRATKWMMTKDDDEIDPEEAPRRPQFHGAV